jgi:hypothetical protein
MSDKNNAFEVAIIDYFLRPGAAAPARPTQIYVGLATAATDTESPSFTEANYAGYARQPVTYGASSQVGGGAQAANTNEILFPAVAGGAQGFTHFVISDAVSGSGAVVHMVKAIPGAPVTVNVGDIPRFAVGAITHTET